MLPAISADLPALLVPPSNKDAGQPLKTSDGFGPSARVELSPQKAVQAQSNNPSSGLYGADGQFVEAAGRRQTTQTSRNQAPPAPATPAPPVAKRQTDETTNDRAAQNDRPTRRNEDVKQELLKAATDVKSRSRDLSLAEFDAAVPPAAREELRALADRVNRRTTTQTLEPRDYKRISELFDRVGRFGDAKQALNRAEKLEARNEPKTQPTRETTDAGE